MFGSSLWPCEIFLWQLANRYRKYWLIWFSNPLSPGNEDVQCVFLCIYFTTNPVFMAPIYIDSNLQVVLKYTDSELDVVVFCFPYVSYFSWSKSTFTNPWYLSKNPGLRAPAHITHSKVMIKSCGNLPTDLSLAQNSLLPSKYTKVSKSVMLHCNSSLISYVFFLTLSWHYSEI